MTDNDDIAEVNQEKFDKQREEVGTWKANIQLAIVLGLIILGIFVSQLLSGTEDRQIEDKAKKDLLVEVIEIAPQTKNITFTKTGNIEVDGQINIVPQVSGRVVSISDNLNNGGVFDEDEKLFSIEQADFINQINIAKAQVEQARTTVAIQKAETTAAIAEWTSLNPNKPAPDLVARKPQLNQAEAGLLAARAQLEDARLNYNRSKFSYNFSGRIVDTSIELGQFLQVGQSYGTAYPVNALEVTVPITDKLLPYIQDSEGSMVKISTDYAGEELKLDGKIVRIGSTLNRSTRFIDVVIQPSEDNWERLIPGVFVDVEFFGKEINNVWEIPTKTIQGQNKIWIVQDDNTLKSMLVDLISTNDDTALTIGNGSTVKIVSGLLKGANDGMKVRIKESNQKEDDDSAKSDETINSVISEEE